MYVVFKRKGVFIYKEAGADECYGLFSADFQALNVYETEEEASTVARYLNQRSSR